MTDRRDEDAEIPKRAPRPCPICKAMSTARYHPFCSRRCADIDLHRWFSGHYAVPAVEPPDDAGEGAPRRPEGDDEA